MHKTGILQYIYTSKQEIKEDNSTNIDEQNIAEIINLKEFSKPMIDPPSLEKMLTIDRFS